MPRAAAGACGLIIWLVAPTAAPRAAEDPVACAKALFSASEVATMPRIVVAVVKPEGIDDDVEGFVATGYPVIYVASWSATYKAAEAGDRTAILKLAGILAHERVHVERGPDERAAYEAEIAMLRRCRAVPALIDSVRRAMRATCGHALTIATPCLPVVPPATAERRRE